MKPQGRRCLVQFFIETFGLSRRRACGLAGVSRSVVEYVSRRSDDGPLRERIHHWAREFAPKQDVDPSVAVARLEGRSRNH